MFRQDQIQLFESITEEEVKRTEAHIRNIEWQMEKMQDTHRNDIKVTARVLLVLTRYVLDLSAKSHPPGV